MKLFLKRPICILFFITSVYTYGQWTVYTTGNSGLPSNGIASIAFDTNNVKWIGTDNGLAKFDGRNWTIYDTNDSPILKYNVVSLDVDRFNVIWLGTNGGGAAKFDGTNWTIYDTNNSPIRSNIVSDIVIDNDNIKWFCTTRGLAKFDDINWTIYNTTNSGLPANQTWCIALEDNIKWIGIFAFSGGLAKFNDTNWTVYNSGNSGLPSNTIRGVSVDFLGNKWIATQFGGVAKFNSNANQWTVYNSTNSGLTNNNTTAIVAQNYIKWMGTDGLARYNDTSWIIFDPSNSPLPSYGITELELDRTGRLWIGTTLGLAVYNTGIIGINNQNTTIPKTFELKQNYPNPFNPNTTIEYELYKSAFVTLRIYNIEGTEIRTLENSKKSYGIHKINFDASFFPSGIYYYKMETGGFTETKKMVLIK